VDEIDASTWPWQGRTVLELKGGRIDAISLVIADMWTTETGKLWNILSFDRREFVHDDIPPVEDVRDWVEAEVWLGLPPRIDDALERKVITYRDGMRLRKAVGLWGGYSLSDTRDGFWCWVKDLAVLAFGGRSRTFPEDD